MTRAHKKMHLIIWGILAPVILAIIVLAVQSRAPVPMNDALPDSLISEAE